MMMVLVSQLLHFYVRTYFNLREYFRNVNKIKLPEATNH